MPLVHRKIIHYNIFFERASHNNGVFVCPLERNISIIPTILGNGIRLFDRMEQEIKLRLVKSESSNGIMELVYQKR